MNTPIDPTQGVDSGVARSMSRAQRVTLRTLACHRLFPGYCEIMADTGLKSYKAVDWVLDALERRAMIQRDGDDYLVTDAGRAALKAHQP